MLKHQDRQEKTRKYCNASVTAENRVSEVLSFFSCAVCMLYDIHTACRTQNPPIRGSAKTSCANSKSSGPLSRDPCPKFANPASAPTAPLAPAGINILPSCFLSPTRDAAVVCMSPPSWCRSCSKPCTTAKPSKRCSTNWGLNSCANIVSTETPRPQTKPYEIPTDLLSRVSKKAVDHRPAAGRNCSAQSQVALPGTDGQGRPLWFLYPFGQGASQSQHAAGKFAAPGR